MVYLNYGTTYAVVFYLDGKGNYNGYTSCNLTSRMKAKRLDWTPHVVGDGGGSTNDAKRTAKAYFTESGVEGSFTNPSSKMYVTDASKSYEANQKAWREHYNIKVGSKVRVMRTSKQGEHKWDTAWVRHGMDELVNKVHKAEDFVCDGIKLYGWSVPYFVLEPVD